MHSPQQFARDEVTHLSALPALLRERGPRVHCITNAVAQNFTANVLLAAGGVPSMTHDPEEIAAFVRGADALLVNLGTFDRERRQATDIAVETALRHGIPWVLDPVFIDRSEQRAVFAAGLVAHGPKAIRLNRVEFVALAGKQPSRDAVTEYARARGTVVALSGDTDIVADGEQLTAIANGDELMARVTAMGCAGSALVAACLAVEPDAMRAVAAGLAFIGVAGEVAAAEARGPGSFAAAIIDALYHLDGPTLAARAKVTR
jgi:hydroxyethylthiazole kinase